MPGRSLQCSRRSGMPAGSAIQVKPRRRVYHSVQTYAVGQFLKNLEERPVVDLHHQVSIEAIPAKVYAALVTSDGNRGWWTADSAVETQVGGAAVFGFDGRAMIFHMTVERLVPNAELVMSCRGDHPEWQGTRLTRNRISG